MRRSPRGKLVFVAGSVLIAVPFAFGVLRAASTGSDVRYLWVALATMVGAAGVMTLGKQRGTSVQGILVLLVAAVVIATLFGRVAAALVGARSPGASWFVAAGFGVCQAAGCALVTVSRMRTMGAEWRDAEGVGR